MSSRSLYVLPKCLNSRLAQTCACARSLPAHRRGFIKTRNLTYTTNCIDVRDRDTIGSQFTRDLQPPVGNPNFKSGSSLAVPSLTSTQTPEDEPAHSTARYRFEGDRTVQDEDADRPSIYKSTQGNVKQVPLKYGPRRWLIQWENLHTELLEASRDITRDIKIIYREQRNFAKAYIGHLNSDEYVQKWNLTTTAEKVEMLPSLLIGSLAESAAQTLFLLTNLEPLPNNFRTRMQCLRYIHLEYPEQLEPESETRQVFKAEINKLRSPDAWWSSITVPHLDTLLTWSNSAQRESLITDFFEHYPFAQSRTLLPMIESYANDGKIDRALELFKRLPEDWLQNPPEEVRSVRDHLLRHDTVTKTETGSNFKILPQLLALGMPADAALHNVVIEAAIANDASEVAWDLYRYLKSTGMEVDARSHLVLLRDAYQRCNVTAVNDIMTAIHENEQLVKDPYLIAYSMNIVRNICFFERRTSSLEALSHIMALYDRAYCRAPLYKLKILSEDVLKNNSEGLDMPNPTPVGLAFTVWSYILVQYSVRPVDTLWDRIEHLIRAGDAEVITAAKSDIIYNGLILFYSRTPSSMVKALQIVQYMLQHDLCAPSARTWDILLCGFLKHNQGAQAETVLRMMRLRGFKIEEWSEERKSSSYYSMKDMIARVSSTLNERPMPSGLNHLMSESESLISVEKAVGRIAECAEAVIDGPNVWKGFADMRPADADDSIFSMTPDSPNNVVE